MYQLMLGKRLYRFALAAVFVVSASLLSCKSVGPLEVEKSEYELPGSAVVDTINARTNDYTYYHLSTDQPTWVLVDTQTVYNANQQLTFVVLENRTGQDREAKIILSGDGLTPVEVHILQHPGGPGKPGEAGMAADPTTESTTRFGTEQYRPNGGEDAFVEEKPVHRSRRRKKRRIRTESALVELPVEQALPEADEQLDTADKPTAEAAPEKPKPTFELSSDMVSLGASEDLASDDIVLTAKQVDAWALEVKDPWITVVDLDGVELKNGSGDKTFKVRTITANPSLEQRKTTITFTAGELKRVLEIVQKPTEATVTFDKKAIALDGDKTKAQDVMTITAQGTNFTISGVPAWLKFSAMEGKIGANPITIEAADDNTTPDTKTADITVSSTGNVIQKTFTVTQAALPAPIEVSELSGNLERDKESIQTFTVTASKDWKVEVPSNVTWFSLDVTAGAPSEEEATVTVTATEDNTGLPRKATLYVVSGKFKRGVVVIQDGDQEGEPVEQTPPQETPPAAEQQPQQAPATPSAGQQAEQAQPVANPQISFVAGTKAGEFTSYALLGSPQAAQEDPTSPPASLSTIVSSNVDFVIESEPFENADTFYAITVNQRPYKFGDTIKRGDKIELGLRALSDNIQKQEASKVGHVFFRLPGGDTIRFRDQVTGSESLAKFEIKQEPYKFRRPYIKVYGLDFDGYNSTILLGNPGAKGADALPTTVSFSVDANTAFALTLLAEGGGGRKQSQFTISYAAAKEKTENVKRYSYKMGEKLAPGQYNFTVSTKKNYVDPQGVGARYTESFSFNTVDGKALTPYEYVDMDNYSVDLSYFRELLLIEQESFDSGAK